MRIAFLNSIEAGTFGGMEQWIQMVSAGLLPRGHSVYLLGRPRSSFLKRVGRNVPGVHPVTLNISGDFNPFTIGKLRRFLSRERIDLLCANFNKDIRLGGIAARLNGDVKVVWSAGINITKNKFSHRWLTPRLVDRVIVPSNSLKGQITQHGHISESTVDVIPIGIEDTTTQFTKTDARRQLREKYDLPEGSVVAVTVGRFVNHKGHPYLIEAAREMVAKHRNLVFMFLGDGPREKELRQLVGRMGLSERVVFAGMLDNIELELAGADIMIHPSIEEPFGIALLEGMRAGLPIIASRVGGIPEVVADGETALLFEPGNAQAIANAADKIIGNENLMCRFGEAGRERWRNLFSHKVMIDRIEAVLTAIVSSSGGTNVPAATRSEINKLEII